MKTNPPVFTPTLDVGGLTVAYIFERYPVLSQTFFRRELAGLRDHGIRIEIHSLFPPRPADLAQLLPGQNSKRKSPTHQTTPQTRVPSPLPDKGEGLPAVASRVAKAGQGEGLPAVASRVAKAGSSSLIADIPVDTFRWWESIAVLIALPRELLRDPALLRDGWHLFRRYRPTNPENFWSTIWAVVFAICRARRFRQHKPDIIHGVWATAPATAAAILARLCNVPFSFGGHAYDIYRHGGDAFLEPKLRAAAFVHTTTNAAAQYLRDRAHGAPVKIVLARRGLEKLPPLPKRDATTSTSRPIRLLSVGRLVPKKGHVHQLAACSLLKSRGVPFVATIVGDGPLRRELQQQIDRTGLHDFVTLTGPLPPDQVNDQYLWADIFWHTGIVDPEGDRDGIPNVIPEAFARCLPVISSPTAGPMEAVTHDVTGIIADPSNPAHLTTAVQRLAADPALRQRLSNSGRAWTEHNFLIATNAAILARAFRETCRR
ncbi:MAG TPA: glycosyltransferase family 4 protein [Verrucomicrobiae bacterium]|nr:glycosyltransferase family 4 protein [Verrucomicrobiae bacterium]